MNEKSELRDLTSFLLEWRDTCAIDNCPEANPMSPGPVPYSCRHKNPDESDADYVKRIRGDVVFVHRLADAKFERLVKRVRPPDKVGFAKKLEDAKKKTSTEDPSDSDFEKDISQDIEGCEGAEDPTADVLDEGSTGVELDGNPPPEYSIRRSQRDPASGRSLDSALKDDSNFSQEKLDSGKDPEPAPVHGSAQTVRGQMVSEYRDIVDGWNGKDERRTHAFHVLEIYLYSQKTISGRPFKNHLFEVVAARDGVGGIWGYLYKRVIPTMVRKSYRTVTVADDNLATRNPTGMNPTEVWTSVHAGAYQAGVDEAADALFRWTEDRWPVFDVNDKLALLCTVLEVSMNDPRIVAMTTVGRQAFYNRKDLARRALEFLFDRGFEKDEVLKVLAGPFQSILMHFAKKDPACGPFLEFLKENAKEAGK